MQLIRTGFDSTLAASLATERAIDLHALIELVERGCPPPLAARILAPLDHGEEGREDAGPEIYREAETTEGR